MHDTRVYRRFHYFTIHFSHQLQMVYLYIKGRQALDFRKAEHISLSHRFQSGSSSHPASNPMDPIGSLHKIDDWHRNFIRSYTGCKISASLRYITVRGTVNMGRTMVAKDVVHAITSPPYPYDGWLTADVCICDCQRSSEISCDKPNASVYTTQSSASMPLYPFVVWCLGKGVIYF
jgi:hypothetical protein